MRKRKRFKRKKTRKDKEMSAYTSDRMPGCISIRLVDRMPPEYASDRI